MISFKTYITEKCWPGYKRVPGKKEYSLGSCMKEDEGMEEGWSQKYKSSINCSHPKGFSQKAHCAGKKKHNESVEMEHVCPDCGMCQTHGSVNESAAAAIAAATAIAKKKSGNYDAKGFRKTPYKNPDSPNIKSNAERKKEIEESAAWQRSAGKNPEGGLNRKGIASYRAEHPGSKLSLAVTTKPSKLKPGSKSANRRKSFCARMSGMKAKLTSAKTAHDPDSRINKSLRKWNC
jgi:hypothetical protein